MKHVRFSLFAVAIALSILLVAPAVALADATISGTVTDSVSGSTVFDQSVELFTQVDGTWNSTYSYSTTTDAQGYYTLTVPAGDYELLVASSQTYQDWWWSGGGADQLSASTLTLADGDDDTINVALALNPVVVDGWTQDIEGNDLPNITVNVYNASDDGLVGTTTSGANGWFSLSVDGLFAGDPNEVTSVKVGFSDPSGAYADQFYSGRSTLAAADPQGCSPGTVVSVQSALAASEPGEVEGTTLTATGAVVSGITVTVTDKTGNDVYGTTTSDSSGHYDIGNIPVGYSSVRVVSFHDPSGTYQDQSFDETFTPGTPFTLNSALLSSTPIAPAGEGDWVWQNPEPQGNDLNAISGPDVGDVWAVGNAGAVVYSSNGGTIWQNQLSGTQADLYGVSFPDDSHGWAVGAGGTIVATTDGGVQWSSEDSQTSEPLYAVRFVDDSHGWAVGYGGTIVATTDGGATWTSQTSGTVYPLEAVTATDASHAWIGGDYGTLLATTDGGSSWTTQTSGTTADILSLTMPDGTHGWAATDGGQILATTDGGTSWAPRATWTGHAFTSVWACNADDCWVADDSGDISYTTDGGTTWYGGLQSSQELLGICCPSAQRGWAVGTAGAILYTGNGQDWSPFDWAPAGTLTFVAASFADDSDGMALSYNGVYATTDGGTTWHSQGVGANMNGISHPDALHAWAVGVAGTIDATTDGGTSWTTQTSNTTSQLYGVSFPDASHGWAVGAGGTILATTDGGNDWTAQTSGTTQDLEAVSFADDTHGVAAGMAGTLLTTTDGGDTWATASSGTLQELYGVSCPNDSDAWAVGGNGTILHSTDGYQHWLPESAGGENFGVSFCNADDGWIASASGLLATTDGGLDWVPQITHSQYEMSGVSAVDPTHCWAVGFDGTILARYNAPPDTTPPVTTCSGADALWHRSAVTLTLTATDNSGGSGVKATYYKIDSGSWTEGTTVVVPAPANHSNDGIHTVSFYSVDVAGNAETPQSVTVKIDTTGPVTAGKNVSGKKGHAVKLAYCVSDALSPQDTAVTLVVKNSHGKVVKTVKLGTRTNKKWYTASWTTKTAGTYHYYVTAKDLAGNAQSHEGGGKITIR
jgi:photosystem II stability/assembly factor-like uncharacterized protein